MREERFRQLVRKYVNNQCSVDEIKLLLELIKNGKYDQLLREEIDNVEWQPENEAILINNPGIDEVLDRIKGAEEQRFKQNFMMLSKLAAVFIGFLIAIVFVFDQATKEHVKIVSAPFGETLKLQLPDKTNVTLNANSKIRYSSELDEDLVREVWVEGEAYFSVCRNEQKFIVHTRNLDVEVLGTEFNVNDRRKRTKVVLEEGKIKLNLSDVNKSILMQPGELVEYSKSEADITQRVVDTKKFTSWTDNKIVFDETPLWEVSQILEDIHGLRIEFKNHDHRYERFTGIYELQEPHVIVSALERAFDFKTKMTKDLITFE
ncbi:MAG: FecR domain-containing protein [Cytophagales bacterium]|nr:FecR domain-containing protein [Cytophagales bacterium]